MEIVVVTFFCTEVAMGNAMHAAGWLGVGALGCGLLFVCLSGRWPGVGRRGGNVVGWLASLARERRGEERIEVKGVSQRRDGDVVVVIVEDCAWLGGGLGSIGL
jgi:hypothetical protein